MHKNLYFWVALFVVFLFGMTFQSMIQRGGGSKATDLTSSHQGAPGTNAKPAGINSDGVNVAQFTATLKKGLVVLQGKVDSPSTVEEIGAAAKKSTGIEEVDNQLVVGKNVMTPEWKSTLPNFLTAVLSHKGVKQFTAEGNGLKLDGAVTGAAKLKLAQQAADMVPGLTLLTDDLMVQKQTVSPVLIAKKQGDEVTLTGLLASGEYRTKLISLLQAALPETKVNDQIQMNANVIDPWWASNAETLVPMFLAAIETDGSIEYWNSHLLISGSITSKEISEKLGTLASGLGKPDDYSVENYLRIVPQEHPEVSLFRDQRGQLTVEGQVASTVFKNQILGGLMRHNPKVRIKDKLEVTDTVKDLNIGDPGELVKELMFNVKGGMLKITEEGIKMAGEANTADLKDELMNYATAVIGKQGRVDSIVTSAKSLVGGVSQFAGSNSESGDSLNDPEAKNVNFKALAVYFNSGRSTVRDTQISNLRLTARILRKKIPNTKVVVVGYADHVGNVDTNRVLSLKRANTVRDILVSYGVPRERMEVNYIGEDASNYRGSDLWRSRRVELSLFNK